MCISWADTNFKRRLTGSPGGSWTGGVAHTGKVYDMMKYDYGNFYAYCQAHWGGNIYGTV